MEFGLLKHAKHFSKINKSGARRGISFTGNGMPYMFLKLNKNENYIFDDFFVSMLH